MLKALIFDLDGTLIKLTLPLEAMRSATKAYFIERGLPSHLLDQADGINSSTIKAKEYFLAHGCSTTDWERMQKEIDDTLSKQELEVADKVQVLDGVIDTLKHVKALGIKTAILTNNAREAVTIMLELLPFSGLFNVIQTRHESPNPKPFPDGLISVTQKLEVALNETVYIGDAVIDVVAAQRAGIEFWGVVTGSAVKDDLITKGATIIFDSFEEILPMVEKRLS